MLKVLKYDLKSMGKSLTLLYVGLLVMAATLRLLSIAGEHITFFKLIGQFMLIFFIIILVGAFFYTFFISIKRYYKSLYGDEGYLTHTLPVKINSLLTSKIISSIIYIIITTIVAALAVFITFDLTNILKSINELIVTFSSMLNISNVTLYLLAALFMLLSYISYIMLVYASISLGHSHNKNKLVMSVVYGVVLYYAGQVISLIFLSFMFISNHDLLNQLNQPTPPVELMSPIFIFTFIVNTALLVLYYFLSYNRLKHLNIA